MVLDEYKKRFGFRNATFFLPVSCFFTCLFTLTFWITLVSLENPDEEEVQRKILNDSALSWRESKQPRQALLSFCTSTHLHLVKKKIQGDKLVRHNVTFQTQKGGQDWLRCEPETCISITHRGGNTIRWQKSFQLGPADVYFPFTISNPVWKPVLNVSLPPKLACVLRDWLKYCNPALSDHPELCISARPIR